ncbi:MULTISPECIES: TIGR03086 family metal-binding protein [unclassified Saccharothrix]|uniref:TIGR03086 family metal-binding protein n=1 Tax=unclassified Saccharothrix TaxID=2593673 RepID=UPI00307F6C6C
MIHQEALADLVRGKDLAERATGYARFVVNHVTADDLSLPTPCRPWDMRTLLWHVNDSLATLAEGIENRRLGLAPGGFPAGDGDVLLVFRRLTTRLLESSVGAGRDDDRLVDVGGEPLHSLVLAGTGALEIAVHGWDIARTCGLDCVIPDAFATDLYNFARAAVGPTDRHPQFADPVPVTASATPGDRLVAYLGRDPGLVLRR